MRNPVLGLIWHFLAKILPSELPEPLIRIWRTRIFEQNFCFTSIYMLTGDQKSKRNLHNVAKKSHVRESRSKISQKRPIHNLLQNQSTKLFNISKKVHSKSSKTFGPFNLNYSNIPFPAKEQLAQQDVGAIDAPFPPLRRQFFAFPELRSHPEF